MAGDGELKVTCWVSLAAYHQESGRPAAAAGIISSANSIRAVIVFTDRVQKKEMRRAAAQRVVAHRRENNPRVAPLPKLAIQRIPRRNVPVLLAVANKFPQATMPRKNERVVGVAEFFGSVSGEVQQSRKGRGFSVITSQQIMLMSERLHSEERL